MPYPVAARGKGVLANAFTPASISGNVGYWLGTNLSKLWQDSIRTLQVGADGDPVGACDEGSSNGQNMLQATSANKPTYKDPGHLLFDGNDFLKDATLTFVAKPASFFARVNAAALGNRSIYSGAGGSLQWRIKNTGQFELLVASVALVGTSTGSISVGEDAVVGVTYSSAGAFAFYKNAIGIGSGTNNRAVSADSDTIGGKGGATEAWSGNIKAVAVYNNVISSGDITLLTSWMQSL